jgi:hypothetical protein
MLPTNFVRKFPLFECIEACRQNCKCEAIAKETIFSGGQLCEREQECHLLAFLSFLIARKVYEV